MRDLDAFLEQFQGEVESQGTFKVAIDKARHKLQEFRLADPGELVLELFAAAHLGGAKTFRAERRKKSLYFEFDGATFSHSDLENIGEYLYSGSEEKRLRRLSVCLSTLESMAISKAVFSSISDDGSRTMMIHPKKQKKTLKLNSKVSSKEPRNSLEIFGMSSSVLDWTRVSKYLERCVYTLTYVKLDQVILTPDLPSAPYRWFFKNPDSPAATDLARFQGTVKEIDANFSALIFVGRSSRHAFGFQCLVDGVAYQCNPELLGSNFTSGLISSQKFQLDLSHSGVLNNSDFQQQIQQLQKTIHENTWSHTRLVSSKRLPGYWIRILQESHLYFLEVGESQTAEEIGLWIKAAKEKKRRESLLDAKRMEEVVKKQAAEDARLAEIAEEKRISQAVQYPEMKDLQLALTLESSGRFEEARLLRRNLARVCLTHITFAVSPSSLRNFCLKAHSYLTQQSMLPHICRHLERHLDFQVRLSSLQIALCQGKFEVAVKLSRSQSDEELLATCLELWSTPKARREALALRAKVAASTDSLCLKTLRLKVLVRRARGNLSLASWVRLYVMTRWSEMSAKHSLEWRILPLSLQVLADKGHCDRGMEQTLRSLEGIPDLSEATRQFLSLLFLSEVLRKGQFRRASDFLKETAFPQQSHEFFRKLSRLEAKAFGSKP